MRLIKKGLVTISLFVLMSQAHAMSDATQAVVVTSAAGLINAGTAIYMQGQGMNPQFVTLPNGTTTVMPNNSNGQSATGASPYQQQNDQTQKQDFFSDNNN